MYTSVAQELKGVKGKFFTNSHECWKPPGANDKNIQDFVWKATEELVGVKSHEKI